MESGAHQKLVLLLVFTRDLRHPHEGAKKIGFAGYPDMHVRTFGGTIIPWVTRLVQNESLAATRNTIEPNKKETLVVPKVERKKSTIQRICCRRSEFKER